MREGFYISNKKSRRERYVIRDDVVEHRGFVICCGYALHTDDFADRNAKRFSTRLHRSRLKTVH